MSEKSITSAGHKCQALIHVTEGVPIVFLHGFTYTIEIWQRISLVELLGIKRLPFLALDMPYGQKSDCHPKTHGVEENVAVLQEAYSRFFDTRTPVVVGASLGGHIALQYAARFPVAGLLLVAPSRVLDEALMKAYPKFNFPVRIIWGTHDNIISGEDMRTLTQKLPLAKLVTYQGGGHSAYKDKPDQFKRDLLELYADAESTLKA